MYNNPFLNNLKTPQQYQQEINQLNQNYASQYNQLMGQQNVNIPNTFSWKYIQNENEVENSQVPANGNPFMFVGNGILYIKKWQNGQSYIQAYSFAPINKTDEVKTNTTENVESASNDLKTTLNKILEQQQQFNSRLSALEGTKVEKVQGEVIDNPFMKGNK
jgi:hypothetical protein